jgi:hypothetical protein
MLGLTAKGFTYIQLVQVLFAKIYFHDARHSTKSDNGLVHQPKIQYFAIVHACNPFAYVLAQSASVLANLPVLGPSASLGPLCQSDRLNPSAIVTWLFL